MTEDLPKRTEGEVIMDQLDMPRVIALYENGYTCKEIAAIFGCYPSIVYKSLRASGQNMRLPEQLARGKSTRLGIDIQQVADLYRQGMAVEEIAQHFGCSTVPIKCRIKAAGIKQKTRDRALDQDDIVLIKSLCEQGRNVREIAMALGWTDARVRKYRQIADIDLQSPDWHYPQWIKRHQARIERSAVYTGMIVEGMTQKQIAEKVGLSHQRVSQILNYNRPQKSVTKKIELKEEMCRLRSLGHSQAEIGRTLGVSKGVVNGILYRAGKIAHV